MRRALLLLLPLVAGCVGLPKARTGSCAEAKHPVIRYASNGEASTQISILTYNVEGLPRPARRGRASSLREIGRQLAVLRASGKAPDIIMFQEVFSRPARRAIVASGYRSLAPGPSHAERRPPRWQSLPGRPKFHRGEIGLKFLSSGLVIASDYPILDADRQPFARGSCAGYDCLANKGVQFARVAIPGVPGSIDLFNTHMNAMRAARVAPPRYDAAHRKQVAEIADFIERAGDQATPTVLGGDFNMRRSETRFGEFSRRKSLVLVHRFCSERPEACDVRMSWDGDEPWMDTQDLQLFLSGDKVRIRPVRVEAMFDGGSGGPLLSDHDGLLVTYELRWPANSSSPIHCPAAPSA